MRANIRGKLSLLVYAKAASYHIDPIEKKPLFHFLPGSQIFSLGTYGCSFGCEFCQNWEISQTPKLIKMEVIKRKATETTLEEIIQFINKNSVDLPPKKIVDLTLASRLPSIAFTYNEPTIFAEYAADTMKLAKPQGVLGVFVSSGYESAETLDLLEGYIDAYNIDLKGATEEFYQKYCHTHLQPVLSTIEEVLQRKKWLEITTLLIPQVNTSEKDLRFIAHFIASLSKDIPWHLTAFSPQYKMSHHPPTDFVTLRRAYEIGKEAGLNFVYTGNLPDTRTQSTFCPACEALLIERIGYSTQIKDLNPSTSCCQKCQTVIPGIWNLDKLGDR